MKKFEFKYVPSYVCQYLEYLITIRALSMKTVNQYYLDLRIFFRYLMIEDGLAEFEDFDKTDASSVSVERLKKLTLSDFYSFLTFATTDRENNTRARARKISALRSFFKYLNKFTLLDSNPTLLLELPKERHRLPVYLSCNEAVDLLNNIKGHYSERDFAMITLFLNCGLRLSELVGINISNITGTRNLRVIGKGGKERSLYLNDACVDALDKYMDVRKHIVVKPGNENALFISRNGTRISNRMVEIAVKKHLKENGLDSEKYSPHKLRHTAATLMHQNGVDIRVLQEILGHSNLGTTQIYTHLESSEIKTALEDNPLSRIHTPHEKKSDKKDE